MTQLLTETNITLVTLQNCPLDLAVSHCVFEKAAELNIDLDMIALSPALSTSSSLSFTLADQDLPKLLTFSKKLQEELHVQTGISPGNCKIVIADSAMKNSPGFAGKIFGAVATVGADIRMITTAETEISLLVPSADFETTTAAIRAVIG